MWTPSEEKRTGTSESGSSFDATYLLMYFFVIYDCNTTFCMYNLTRTKVTYITITTYKLQITIPISIAYNINNDNNN